jgi:hypothetical protein
VLNYLTFQGEFVHLIWFLNASEQLEKHPILEYETSLHDPAACEVPPPQGSMHL